MNLLLIALLILGFAFAKEAGFTQEDRERLIRLETTLRTFMEQVDKRFEQVDKGISDFREDTNRRFEKLGEDINARFEQMDKRLEQVDKRINELREDTNRRFELVSGMIEQLYTFLWILAGIFTTLTAVVIGFAYWDRRTIIRKAREETIDHLEREGVLRKLLQALREKAKTDRELEAALKKYGLLAILIGLLLLFVGFSFPKEASFSLEYRERLIGFEQKSIEDLRVAGEKIRLDTLSSEEESFKRKGSLL